MSRLWRFVFVQMLDDYTSVLHHQGTRAAEGMWTSVPGGTVSPDEPAETLAWLATEPEGGRHSGRYFYRKAEETPVAAAQDDAAARHLWAESETMLARLGF